MRRKVSVVSGVTIVLVACSGGANATSVADYCNQFWAINCQRMFACFQGDALDSLKAEYGTEAACVKQLQSDAICATAVCPQGQTFVQKDANHCLDVVNGFSCDVVRSRTAMLPPECSGGGFTSVCK